MTTGIRGANLPLYDAIDTFCSQIADKTKQAVIKWEETPYGFTTTGFHTKLTFLPSRAEIFFHVPGTPYTLHIVLTDEKFSKLHKIIAGKSRKVVQANYRCYYTVQGEQLLLVSESYSDFIGRVVSETRGVFRS